MNERVRTGIGQQAGSGFLALVGGDEFMPGNEAHDRLLVEHRAQGPAYVVPTAAARQRPDLAVATATKWFKALGLDVVELPVLKRSDASRAVGRARVEQPRTRPRHRRDRARSPRLPAGGGYPATRPAGWA